MYIYQNMSFDVFLCYVYMYMIIVMMIAKPTSASNDFQIGESDWDSFSYAMLFDPPSMFKPHKHKCTCTSHMHTEASRHTYTRTQYCTSIHPYIRTLPTYSFSKQNPI